VSICVNLWLKVFFRSIWVGWFGTNLGINYGFDWVRFAKSALTASAVAKALADKKNAESTKDKLGILNRDLQCAMVLP